MSYRAAVALGSNLGSRWAILRRALEGLGDLGTVTAVSSLYETAPVGGPDQGPFLNAVAVLETDIEPAELLQSLHRLEDRAERIREERWGPRTLDLDLVTVVDDSGEVATADQPELTLPHPRARERRFVLEPLAEIWPDAPLGAAGSASDALPHVGDQDVELLARDWVVPMSSVVPWVLVSIQMVIIALVGLVVVLTGDLSNPLLATGGLAIAAAGAGISLAGMRSLGSNLTPLPEPLPGAVLVSTGPYRWVRHPIYSGIVLTLAGVGTAAGSLPGLAATGVLGVFFWFKAGYEESRLCLQVAGYAAYQRRVRGRLVPWGSRPT